MELEQFESLAPTEKEKNFLFQVTPFSKYVAMTLFVVLPFVGGYLGYYFAPEKVVEIEKIVEVEKVVAKEARKPEKEQLGWIRGGGSYAVYRIGDELVFEESYWTEPGDTPPKLDGVEASSLKLIPPRESQVSATYGNDGRSVYCLSDGSIINADSSSFEYIGMYVVPQTDTYAWITAKDANKVFFNCEQIIGADPATYQSVKMDAYGSSLYAVDKENVYFNGQIIVGADPASFSLNPQVEEMFAAEYREACAGEEWCIYFSPFFNALSLYGEIDEESGYIPSITYDAYDHNQRYLLGEVVADSAI